MKNALDNLKKDIAHLNSPIKLTDEQWQEVTGDITVGLMAGGVGSRFQTVVGNQKVNKNSYKLPNGDTMIEMAIRMYRDAGIKDFVALVFHEAHSIEELLGDGSQMGVNIKYSYDPEQPVGKGGAVLNALQNGSIPKDKHLIIHNPDDVILNYEGSFPRDIISGHIEGVNKGNLATVVVVEETPYSFTGMKVKDNSVTQIEMYPMIPIPTHIGVTVFSPEALELFEQNFSLQEKSDFEKVLFPVLAEDHKLYATSIPNETWLAVNNPKSFKELLKYLGE